MQSKVDKILVKRLFKTKFKPLYTKSLTYNVPDILFNEIRNRRINKIIDLGSGYGYVLYALNENKLLPAFAVGIEQDFGKCLSAKRNIPELKVVCANIYDTVLSKEAKFDLVINEQVIEHVEDENALLRIIYDLLKEKGRLYISSIIRKKYAFWIYRYKGKIRLNPNHIREYASEDEFKKILVQNQFKIISLRKKRFIFNLSYWLEICLVNFGLMRQETLKNLFDWNYFLNSLRKCFGFWIPGFYLVEALAEKI